MELSINNLEWSEFQKVELRAGTIIEAEDFPKARNPSYILKVDFGEEIGIKNKCPNYSPLLKRRFNW